MRLEEYKRKEQVLELLNKNGFIIEDTGGNCEWAVQEENETLVAITSQGDPSLPESIDSPITVGVYLNDNGFFSGNSEPQHSFNVSSLVSFLQ